MFNKLTVVLVLSFVALTLAQVEIKSCPTGELPDEVWSSYCDKTPCEFWEGEPIGFNATFTSKVNTASLTVSATATLAIITVPHDMEPYHADGCNHLREGSCPISAGDLITYNMDMPLYPRLNEVSPLLRVYLTDDAGNTMICFGIETTIHKPRK